MKVSSVFSFILPLVSLYALASPLASQETSPNPRAVLNRRYEQTFISAINYNICQKEWGGGEGGPGYVRMGTILAICHGLKVMRLNCRYYSPFEHINTHDYTCGELLVCMPTTQPGQNPDAGCVAISQPTGVLEEGDMDNFACSTGINIGERPLTVLSSITTDGKTNNAAISRCSILKSGTQQYLWDHAPCESESFIVHLAARTSYQACISAAVGYIHHRVGFKWHVLPPGKLINRDTEDEKDETPFSELFTIDKTQKRGPVDFELVVGE
ncbi:hypothetical protein E2P81_ATG07752 [Venturia nashicola]|uniref:Uncharacterized protein n=1 Tax=Venturia nashicola TaxID=86259 RepID=A0A4Z1P5L0_9PEZI|nr:hypothetical protein E6O75_ATG07920 [Venturia nashicola]TLD22559.1 hypothetical protein E2P81_ATG07752 [Venturia nashicola]